MFDDQRSKKIILIAHCILNQNVKIDRCARYPGAIQELADLLVDSGVGLLQMPCPELKCLGLDRQIGKGLKTTIESEDTRVAQRMTEASSIARCHGLANDLINQIREYHKNGFEIMGVIGINGSPICGVETTWTGDQEKAAQGVFIRILDEECRRRGIVLRFRGIKGYEIPQAIAAAKDLLGNGARRCGEGKGIANGGSASDPG